MKTFTAFLVIKDTETNRYYTEDYDDFWSKNIEDAMHFKTENEIDNTISIMLENKHNPEPEAFDNKKFIIIERVYEFYTTS